MISWFGCPHVLAVPSLSHRTTVQPESNLAVFCDFENLAIGARDGRLGAFDIQMALERMLDKGRVLIKRAYSDWKRYSDDRRPMHEAGFELIEVPHVSYSGKNSADIHLVVDALDLCYTRPHIDMFVIMSGDSDFSPLVRKLRENNKRVIGMGVKNATSDLLVENCDEFIYYDDLVRRRGNKEAKSSGRAAKSKAATKPRPKATTATTKDPATKESAAKAPAEKTDKVTDATKTGDVTHAIEIILDTIESLFSDRDGDLRGSHVKQTIKRKRPNFDEAYYGFRTFSALLEEAAKRNLLEIDKPEKGGGYLIHGFGSEA